MVGGQRHAPSAFTPRKDPVPIVQEAGWAPGPVWTGEVNLALTGIRSPGRPARSESLYRVSYPGPLKESGTTFKGVQFVFQHRKLILSLNKKRNWLWECLCPEIVTNSAPWHLSLEVLLSCFVSRSNLSVWSRHAWVCLSFLQNAGQQMRFIKCSTWHIMKRHSCQVSLLHVSTPECHL